MYDEQYFQVATSAVSRACMTMPNPSRSSEPRTLASMSRDELEAEIRSLRTALQKSTYNSARDSDGQVNRILCRAEDVENERGLFRQILDILPDNVNIFFKDTQYRYTYVNETARRNFNRPYEEIVGVEDRSLILRPKDADMYRRFDSTVISTQEKHLITEEWEDELRKVHTFVTTRYPIVDVVTGESLGVISVTQDATEDFERRARIFLMEQLFRTLRHDAINRLAHNLKAQIQSAMEKGDTIAELRLKRLYHAAALLLALIENLGHYAMFQAEHTGEQYAIQPRSIENLSLFESVESVIFGTDFILGELAACQNDVPRDITVRGDETLMRLLLFNLLVNAKKYGPEGQQPIRIHVRDTIRTDGTFLQILVTNQGRPVSPSVQNNCKNPKLGFTEFPPADLDGNQREVKGTGLGMTLCASIAASHGGPREIAYSYEQAKPNEYGWNTFGVLIPKSC